MLELRKYQADDLPFFVKQSKSLILYEPRMGKTVIAMAILAQSRPRSVLIICPVNAFFVWRDHVLEWLQDHYKIPTRFMIVDGDAYDRQKIWEMPTFDGTVSIFVCSHGSFIRDVKQSGMMARFDAIFVDEYHKWLLRKTKSFEALRPLVKAAKRFHPMSGTPIDRGPHQFWPVLHLSDPKYFSSYWDYMNTYCYLDENVFGGKTVIGVKNPEEYYRLLGRFARIRTRKETSIPKITRSPRHVEMTSKQRKHYDGIESNSVTFKSNGEVVVAATSMERVLRLRQLLACPAIFDETWGVGAAITNLASELSDFEEGSLARHVVIYCSFKDALPIWQHYLEGEGFQVVLLHGGISPIEMEGRIRVWRQNKGILICTTAYAQAFSLAGASAAYHIGWDWSANANKQAEDRILPQEGSPVNSFYYIHQGTIEESVAAVVIQKHEITKESLGNPIYD